MSKSLRVRSGCIEHINLALRCNGFKSQRALALDARLSLATVSNCLTGKPVDSASFVELGQTLVLQSEEIAKLDVPVRCQTKDDLAKARITNKHQDWGKAIDVSVFYGRTEEATTLAHQETSAKMGRLIHYLPSVKMPADFGQQVSRSGGRYCWTIPQVHELIVLTPIKNT